MPYATEAIAEQIAATPLILAYMNITPHVAQNVKRSAIDGRTTRHDGYAISQYSGGGVDPIFETTS